MLNICLFFFRPLFSLFLIIIASSYFTTCSTLALKSNGFSDSIIGLIHSSYYGGMLLSAFFTEALIQRWGYNKTYNAACLITIVSILWMSGSDDPWSWVAMRLFAGACMGVIYVVIESWLLSLSSEITRGQVLAIYTVVLYAAMVAGQHLLSCIPNEGLLPFLFPSFILGLGILPLLGKSTYTELKPAKEESPISWVEVSLQSPLGIVSGIFSGFLLGAIYSFAPIFAVEYELSPATVMSAIVCGGVIFQWPLGKLSDIFDRTHLLIMTGLAMVIPCIGILIYPQESFFLLMNLFILGGLSFAIYPQSIALVTAQAKKVSMTAAAAILLLAYGVGSTVGPTVVAQLTSLFGSIYLYAYCAGIGALLATLGLIFKVYYKQNITLEES